MTLSLPYKWDRYWVLAALGEGGMADVYVGIHADGSNTKLLVIKKIKPEFAHDPDFLAMFKNEIRISFNVHSPRIIQTYDFNLDTDEPYVIMEFVEGVVLSEIVKKAMLTGEYPPIGVIVEIVRQTALGLQAAHEHTDSLSGEVAPVIHRDISPQNIMVNTKGFVKIIDFGIAKIKEGTLMTAVGAVKGKPSYMSPEQMRGERDLDGRTDVFSLGIVLWELLTTKRLFKNRSENLQVESRSFTIFPPHMENSQIPREISLLTMEALMLEREERFESAKAFAEALKVAQQKCGLPEGNAQVEAYVKTQFDKEIHKRRSEILHAIEKSKEKAVKIKIVRG